MLNGAEIIAKTLDQQLKHEYFFMRKALNQNLHTNVMMAIAWTTILVSNNAS